MEAVSIMSAEQDEMFQLVAGVLHLGNIDFDGSSDGESSTVKAGTALQIAAKLLGTSMLVASRWHTRGWHNL